MNTCSSAVAAILDRLDRVRFRSGEWQASCPVRGHGKGRGDRNPSLSISEGTDGRVLAKCRVGCKTEQIMAAINLPMSALFGTAAAGAKRASARRRHESQHVAHCEEAAAQSDRSTQWAVEIINKTRRIAPGDVVDRYLRSRGLLPRDGTWWAPDLRIHPRLWHKDTKSHWPAMVGIVRRLDRRVVACHRTFLDPRGNQGDDLNGKAPIDPAKKSLGPVKGAAIRLGPDAAEIVLAEGVESALAAARHTGLTGWACLSALGLATIEIPSHVRFVAVAYDRGGPGWDHAVILLRRLARAGIRARIVAPPSIDAEDPADEQQHNEENGNDE